MRLDKLTWAVRLHKTRSLAAKSCAAEKVKLNGTTAKPSKQAAVGDEVSVKTNPIWRVFKIIALPKSRVSAKLVSQFMIETTSPDELEKLKHYELVNRQQKMQGIKGRPTKKDRRDLNKLNDL